MPIWIADFWQKANLWHSIRENQFNDNRQILERHDKHNYVSRQEVPMLRVFMLLIFTDVTTHLSQWRQYQSLALVLVLDTP